MLWFDFGRRQRILRLVVWLLVLGLFTFAIEHAAHFFSQSVLHFATAYLTIAEFVGQLLTFKHHLEVLLVLRINVGGKD